MSKSKTDYIKDYLELDPSGDHAKLEVLTIADIKELIEAKKNPNTQTVAGEDPTQDDDEILENGQIYEIGFDILKDKMKVGSRAVSISAENETQAFSEARETIERAIKAGEKAVYNGKIKIISQTSRSKS